MFYINDSFLYSLDGENKQKINMPIPQCWCSLALTSKHLYATDSRTRLSRMDLTTGIISTTGLPYTHRGIKLIDEENILTTSIESTPTDIQRISWQ